jgi:hypothetical protein
MLASSTVVRSWLGVSTKNAALAKIHKHSCDVRTATLPVCVVSLGANTAERVTQDGTFDLLPKVAVTFVDECDKADSNESVFVAITEAVYEIIDDISDNTAWLIIGCTNDPETPARGQRSATIKGKDFVVYGVEFDGVRQ